MTDTGSLCGTWRVWVVQGECGWYREIVGGTGKECEWYRVSVCGMCEHEYRESVSGTG